MPTPVDVRTITSADDLIGYLLEVTEEEPRPITRGQANAEWELYPSVWRGKVEPLVTRTRALRRHNWFRDIMSDESRGERELARRYLRDETEPSQNAVRELVMWLITERDIIRKFCGTCDRAALTVPGFSDTRAHIAIREEYALFQMTGAYTALPTPVLSLGPEFAFAQHYGIPTRLLDFSDTPLKAAYFAVARRKPEHGTHFALWVLRRDEDAQDCMERRTIDEFRALRSQVPFLHAQDGLFIACNAASNRFFMEQGRWPALEEVLTGWTIEKIVSPAEIAETVSRRLDRFGIHRVTMMPAYETVSDELNATYFG